MTALLKGRFWKDHVNAMDTQRLALLAGCELRSGDFPFTNDAYNPILGLAYTQISDRHGVNAATVWNFTTDGTDDGAWPGMSNADLFCWNLAYLYRVDPVEYTADTEGAWYALCEPNGLYETNGDAELFIAPGLMYEAARWTLKLSVQVPVWQALDYRPAAEYSLMMDKRFAW